MMPCFYLRNYWNRRLRNDYWRISLEVGTVWPDEGVYSIGPRLINGDSSSMMGLSLVLDKGNRMAGFRLEILRFTLFFGVNDIDFST